MTAINPAAIPQVHGNMDELFEHARALRGAGQALVQRGVDVHAAWQALANFYIAPESAVLLVAMAPVRDIAGRVGGNKAEVGRAIEHYAITMKDIQQRLRQLRVEAEALQTEITAFESESPDWTEVAIDAVTLNSPLSRSWSDDPLLRSRHEDLMRRINKAVADRQAAEVDCANAIAVVHGGRRYRVGDGDGTHEAGEHGWTAERYNKAATEGGLPWGQSSDDENLFELVGRHAADLEQISTEIAKVLPFGGGLLSGPWTARGTANASGPDAGVEANPPKDGKLGELRAYAELGKANAKGAVTNGSVDARGEAEAAVLAEAGVHGAWNKEHGAHLAAEAAVGAKAAAGGRVGIGPVGVSGKAEAFAGANAKGTIAVGKEGVHLGGEAFAGAKATAKGGADVAGIGVNAKAEAWAGAGVAADADVGYKDGKITISGEAGAALGVGGKAGWELNIDTQAVTKTASDAADAVSDTADTVSHWFD